MALPGPVAVPTDKGRGVIKSNLCVCSDHCAHGHGPSCGGQARQIGTQLRPWEEVGLTHRQKQLIKGQDFKRGSKSVKACMEGKILDNRTVFLSEIWGIIYFPKVLGLSDSSIGDVLKI